MKELILTGLATEQQFGKSDTTYFLIFNNGQLRLQITENAAELVVREILADTDSDDAYSDSDDADSGDYTNKSYGDSSRDEAGIDQV